MKCERQHKQQISLNTMNKHRNNGNYIKQTTFMMPKTILLALIFFISMSLQLSAAPHKHITQQLQKLLKARSDIKEMLEESIAAAKKINPDKKTNPVQTLEEYYNYIDEASELIPHQILDNPKNLTRDRILQGICYFYFLIGQPVPQLKNKKIFRNSLQYYPPFTVWLRQFTKTWGDFLSSDKSWNKNIYKEFHNDSRFNLNRNWYESSYKWHSFNDFFSRRLRAPSVRPIASSDDESVVVAPADSTPQGSWKIDEDSNIEIEGGLTVKLSKYYNVNDLLSPDSKYKHAFASGILTHTLLKIYDYHRFHSPVTGTVKEVKKISQNLSLESEWDSDKQKYRPVNTDGWQFTQTRGYVIIETDKFGLVALIPVGMGQAASVNFENKIKPGKHIKKGEMLGCFKFGGSDIIMLFQEISGFNMTAPEENRTSFKHILACSEYGFLNGDKKHLKALQHLKKLDKLAKALKLPPLSSIDKTVTKAQVEMMIYKEIEKSVIPPFDKKKLITEAEKQFTLWKVGDKIKVVDAQGYIHKGELKEITPDYVKIGNSSVYAIDFSDTMKAHLTKRGREAAIDRYVSEHKRTYLRKRSNLKSRIRDSVKEKYYTKYRFVNYKYKWIDYLTYKSILEEKLKRREKKLAILRKKQEAKKKAEEEKKKASKKLQ